MNGQLQLDLFTDECQGCEVEPWWETYALGTCYAYCKKERRYTMVTSGCVRRKHD